MTASPGRLAIAAALLLGAAVPAVTPAAAGGWHLQAGATSFGMWCNERARFDIVGRDPAGPGYFGRIWIIGKSAYDRLSVEQQPDGSLFLVRFLSGAREGEIETVWTYPPEGRLGGGAPYTTYRGRDSDGEACNATMSLINVAP